VGNPSRIVSLTSCCDNVFDTYIHVTVPYHTIPYHTERPAAVHSHRKVYPQDEEVAVDAVADEDAADETEVPEEAVTTEAPQCRFFSVTPTV
jgi:hypothetical protein